MHPLWTIPPPATAAELTEFSRKKARALRDGPGLHPGWLDTRNAECALDAVVHVWGELSHTLLGTGLRPVTGPERHPAQQDAAVSIAREQGTGLGLRVRLDTPPGTGLGADCRVLAGRAHGLELDLLLDLYAVRSADQAAAEALRGWREVGPSADWRTVVLLGGSFPWEARELKDDDLTEWPRLERQVWHTVRDRLAEQGARLVYGDYSTLHPRSGDTRPGGGRGYEKPRYTTDAHFLIGKGARWGSGEESRMRDLAARIVADPEFRPSASAGELWLQEQARPGRQTSAGNPGVWVEKGHVQHITFVARQAGRPDG